MTTRKNISLILGLLFLIPQLGFSRSFESQEIVITAESPLAVEVGRVVAQKGGNVADVAVAVALTLSVTNPAFASLGGGGFALVKVGKEVEALNFRERAPLKAGADFYMQKPKEASTQGGTSVATPGMVAGLWALHQKYGKLKWGKLFNEAIRIAENGYPITSQWAYDVSTTKFDETGKKFFSKDGDQPLKPGDTVVQKNAAQLLKEIQKLGAKAFYQGSIAQDIVQTVQSTGGVIDAKDLLDYKPEWLQPITTAFKGKNVHLMPPPSSGGVVIKTALALIERENLESLSPQSVDEYHVLGEILSRSFRDRSLLGDSDFHKNPLAEIFSEAHIKELADSIDKSKKTKIAAVESSPKEGSNTGHFNVLDNQGNAVAMTLTLNSFFGSGVVTPKYGIVLNDEMDDFTTRPNQPNQFGLIQGQGNTIAPGKHPLSSMVPTFVEENGKVVFALGAPGGPRIISAVLETLYRVLVTKMELEDAMNAPRVHHQFLPDTLFVDKNRFSSDVIKALEAKGHQVKEYDPFNMARVSGVRMNEKGFLEGAWDRRGEGAVGGF